VRIIFDPIRDGLGAIETASSQLAQAQHQLSTGKRVTGAGDDPLAVQQAIGQRATIGSIDAYSRANQSAASRLAAVDNVLTGLSDKLTAVSVAGLSARGSHADATARMAAAERVRSLRDALVTDVNASFQGTYLFAGTNVDQPPYVQSGGAWTYQGNNSVTRVEVDRGRLVSVTFDGQQIIQGSDASDLFTVLDNLASAIETGDAAGIGVGLEAVERAFTRTQRAIGALGADEQGLDEAAVRLASLRQAAETRRSALEDVNMAEAATRMSQADTAYRAALAAVSTAERQSLLDYLR
jgi:flagellar hook-associated protein 3 FlgL